MMRYLLLFYIALGTGICSAQKSSVPPHLAHQWHKIANLPPGSPILVREHDARSPTPCELTWIDNTALACDGMNGRVIYPATSIASVEPDLPRNPHNIPVGLIISAVTGAIVGGLAGSNGNAGTTAAGVFIGAGLVGGFTASISAASFAPAGSPQWGMRIPLRSPHSWMR